MNPLYNFIKKFKITNETSFIDNKNYYVILPNNKIEQKGVGLYNLPKNVEEEFLRRYEIEMNKKEDLYFFEKSKNAYKILLFDIDIKQSQNKRNYTEETIKKIIKVINKNIQKIIKGVDEQNLNVFIFEKEKLRSEDNIYVDGIHLMYPELFCDYTILKNIYDRTAEKINTEEFINNKLKLKDVLNINGFLDPITKNKNNWAIYGSKKQNNYPYLLTKSYDINLTSILEKMKNIDKLKMFSLNNKFEKKIYTNFVKNNKKQIDNEINENVEDITKQIKILTKLSFKNKQLDEVKLYIDILKPSRYTEYNLWLNVGMCLHNIDSSTEMLKIWDNFSKKSTKYKEGVCLDKWKSFNPNNNHKFTMSSLETWARDDNYELYMKKYMQIFAKQVLEKKNILNHHSTIADIIHRTYRHNIVCADSKKNIWYKFENHRWHRFEHNIFLSKILSDNFDIFDKLFDYVDDIGTNEIKDINDEDTIKTIKRKNANDKRNMLTILDILIDKLKDTTYKDKILKECKVKFFVDKFEEMLDTKTNLLCFENGIFDLDKYIFRDGIPEDYLTLSTKLNYDLYDNKIYDKIHDKQYTEIWDFLNSIFPDKEIRDYTLKTIASCLDGYNKNQELYIWLGQGSNGKTAFSNLLNKTLGDYIISSPIEMLTLPPNKAENASPQMAKLVGKRIVIMSEPNVNGGETLQTGRMKIMTGNDKITARKLNEHPFEFTPQFRVMILTNVLLPINQVDDGTWRRIGIIPFKTKFVNTKEDIENESKKRESKYIDIKNYSLDLKIFEWSKLYIYILLYYYKIYKTEGLAKPESILLYIEEYKSSSNVLKEFEKDRLEYTGNKEDILTLSDLFKEFKNWIIIENKQRVDDKKIKIDMQAYFNVYNAKEIKGYIKKNEPPKYSN